MRTRPPASKGEINDKCADAATKLSREHHGPPGERGMGPRSYEGAAPPNSNTYHNEVGWSDTTARACCTIVQLVPAFTDESIRRPFSGLPSCSGSIIR